MSSESENVAILKEAYQRWHDSKAGSVDHWLNLMTDDIQFRSLAAGAQAMAFTRASSSKNDVARYFAGLTADWEMIHYRVEEYIAQGDRVVALSHVSFKHKKTGKALETPKADVHKFRDGKICEFFEFYDTATALNAATP
ncbi:MAG TPA: nuclear transport factor 2 family protein [Candidatus Binatus sp.]|nr:nuclear transport factor 2 family protein [Candidatus Binatus sp.]